MIGLFPGTRNQQCLALVHWIPSWLAWEEIEFTVVHVALPKMTHKPVSTSLAKQAEQALRAYCPDVYTVHVM